MKMLEERPWGTSLWRRRASCEVGVFEDVEDGGEGFVFDGIGLGGDFDEGGADVEGFGVFFGGDAVAAGDGCAGGAGFFEGLVHGVGRRVRR